MLIEKSRECHNHKQQPTFYNEQMVPGFMPRGLRKTVKDMHLSKSKDWDEMRYQRTGKLKESK